MVETICASCMGSVLFDPVYDFKKLIENTQSNREKYSINPHYISGITDKLILCETCLKK